MKKSDMTWSEIKERRRKFKKYKYKAIQRYSRYKYVSGGQSYCFACGDLLTEYSFEDQRHYAVRAFTRKSISTFVHHNLCDNPESCKRGSLQQ